jgi:nucleotide-binding universal stress UspA family protein
MAKVKKILCAVDFSEATPLIAEWAGDQARNAGAELLVMYVVPDLGRYSNFHIRNDRIEDMVQSILDGARKIMEDCLAKHFPGVEAQGLLATGYAPEEILKAAAEHGCDLIVMGTHGRKGIDRIIFGSVAEKVVKTSPIPVLTIRPYGITAPKGRK